MARRAVSACERVHGPEHPALAEALFNLAAILRDRGEQSIAESLLFRVLAIDEKVHGGSHPKTATTLSDLGYLYTKNRRFAEAESHLRRALAIREHILGTEHAHTAQSYHQLGVMFNTLERYDEAEPHFRNALRIFRRTFGSSHPNVAACLGNLGESLRHLDKLDEARSVTREALAIVETGIGVGHPMWFALVVKTGEIALHLENYDEAETHLLSASDWASKRKAETNRERLAVMMSLAELYRRRGELDRALSILGDVLECSDATGDPSKLERQVPLVRTAAIERERGDLRTARRLADEALTLIRGREPINRELEAEALEVIASKTSGNGDAARRAASLEHS
jgi:tetratricopeptide (TPR) repeat protein